MLCTHFSFAKNYFQQEVKYTISVSLNDVKHELSGYETIVYINNSPTELREIYFHLWPNAYKNTETALAKQFELQGNRKMLDAHESDLGFIDSLNFMVDGETVKWEYDSVNIDICLLTLNRPLKSGDSISITTPFRVKIPSGDISRMGHIGQAYYTTQWYPKPAVYDRYGWHPLPYLDQGEFYSEFGSFDVSITLPANYVVASTGDLQTEEEKIFLEKKIEETKNISVFPKDMSFPKSDAEIKTIRYTQNNVHDFAWFADKRFRVLKGSIKLPHERRMVTSWIFFTDSQPHLWKNALEYVNDATYLYSKWLGDYPYNNVTAVDGTIAAGGGMEYPTITIIGKAASAAELELVIAHEVGHNWLYGILGSNERDHAWMDEGINTFYEMRYFEAKYDSGKGGDNTPPMLSDADIFGLNEITDKKLQELEYFITARRNTDQPLNITSEKFSRLNYGANVYAKTGLCFQYLRSYLGDSLFDKCMHAYFNQWKFKHPYPDDVRKIFEDTSGKNLLWFFDDLLKTKKKIDYAITASKKEKSHDAEYYSIRLKNKGRVDGPVHLSVVGENDSTLKSWWIEPFGKETDILIHPSVHKYIRIDDGQNIPEIDRGNNLLRRHGILRKWDKLRFQFAGGFEKPNTTQIFYLPTLGWNHYDKVMAGVALHNIFLPEKKFEYVLMPMYSTRTNSLVGGGNLSYNFYTGRKSGKEHRIRKMTFELSGQSYHFADFNNFSFDRLVSEQETFQFNKVSTRFSFDLRPAKTVSSVKNILTLKTSWVQQEYEYFAGLGGDFISNPPDPKTLSYIISSHKSVFPELGFISNDSKAINPYNISFNMMLNEELFRVALETNYRFSYKGKNRGFDMRMFFGFVDFESKYPVYPDYRLRMSGYTGGNDYMFNHVFLGRAETDGTLSRQFVAEEGGFKTPTATGQSNSWLAALNLKTNIPGRLPIKLFADIGLVDESDILTQFRQGLMYDYGFEITVIPDIFSIYFPIGFSDDIQRYYDANEGRFEKWTQRIRYEFRLEKLNPLKLIRNIDF